jgi:hypothetical protein
VGGSAALPLDAWPGPRDEPATSAALARAERRAAEAERFEGEPDEVAAELVRRLRAAGVRA